MMAQPNTLGYQLTRHEDSTGHVTHLLIINMSSAPTMQHYDPDELWLHVGDERLGFERMILRHPLMQSENRRACAGRIGLCDRKGKCVEFFTYGGHFEAHTSKDITNAVLTSPAPIINLVPNSDAQLLAVESEVLLARYRARSGAGREWVEALLCHVDPFRLYVSVITELLDEIEDIPDEHLTTGIREFRSYLLGALRRARRAPQWPNTIRPLSELLT